MLVFDILTVIKKFIIQLTAFVLYSESVCFYIVSCSKKKLEITFYWEIDWFIFHAEMITSYYFVFNISLNYQLKNNIL